MELHPNKEIIELLSEIEMFKDLDEGELSELSAKMVSCKYDAGKEIFREGDPGGKMLIIAGGTVEIQKHRSHGTSRVVIARFDRGGVIGEMSLVDRLPRSASVIAVQPTKVYEFSLEAFEEMTNTQKDLTIKVLKGLANLLSIRLRNTSGWFADVF